MNSGEVNSYFAAIKTVIEIHLFKSHMINEKTILRTIEVVIGK